MAKRTPLTFQEERLQRLTRNAELKIVALKVMIDTAQKIVTAESVDVGTPPQTIELSAGGSLDLGAETPLRVIGAITVEASHTGDTSETEVGKITMPANSMGLKGFVRISVFWRWEGTGNKTIRIKFGGSTVKTTTASGALTMVDDLPTFVWNQNDAAVQSSGILLGNVHARPGEMPFAGTIDTTADVDITFTVENAVASATSRLRFAAVEAFYQD